MSSTDSPWRMEYPPMWRLGWPASDGTSVASPSGLPGSTRAGPVFSIHAIHSPMASWAWSGLPAAICSPALAEDLYSTRNFLLIADASSDTPAAHQPRRRLGLTLY